MTIAVRNVFTKKKPEANLLDFSCIVGCIYSNKHRIKWAQDIGKSSKKCCSIWSMKVTYECE